MKSFISLFILMFCLFSLISQDEYQAIKTDSNSNEIVIMKPTGQMKDELPVMIAVHDSTELYKHALGVINNSFVKETIDLYFAAQNYLSQKKNSYQIQPAYLALSENQGGFARWGFILQRGGVDIVMKKSPYVDIMEKNIWARQDKLMSFTQLYPHEMGHILLRLLSNQVEKKIQAKGVDMHFFSLKTDYATAFNEGFAEHIENVSRLFEENTELKNGIFEDIETIAQYNEHYITGFEKDFVYPWRLGYYKATMLNWYQRFEDYKRYAQAVSGDVRYKNASLALKNKEDQLSYRNAGVRLDHSKLKNIPQLLATEGVISAFFTKLSTSDLGKRYVEPSFYSQFRSDHEKDGIPPHRMFTAVENQFLKYFAVFQESVNVEYSDKAQLIDFMKGYIQLFPDEKDELIEIYEEITQQLYTNSLPPQIWLMVKNHSHRILAFDPFDAITVPLYTFELNSAEVEDLMTLEAITRDEAEKVVSHRDTRGYFQSLKDLDEVVGLSAPALQALKESNFDQDHYDALEDPKLNISALLWAPVKYLYSRGMLYFVGFLAVLFLFIRRDQIKGLKLFALCLKYLLLWIALILSGAILVFMTPTPLIIFCFAVVILFILSFVIYRKRSYARFRTLIMLSIMSVPIIISIL